MGQSEPTQASWGARQKRVYHANLPACASTPVEAHASARLSISGSGARPRNAS